MKPRLVIGSILILNLVIAIFRINAWPLSTYLMFTDNSRPETLSIHLPFLVDDGQTKILRMTKECANSVAPTLLKSGRFAELNECLVRSCGLGRKACPISKLGLMERQLSLKQKTFLEIKERIVYRATN
jgi:hypothetical protein